MTVFQNAPNNRLNRPKDSNPDCKGNSAKHPTASAAAIRNTRVGRFVVSAIQPSAIGTMARAAATSAISRPISTGPKPRSDRYGLQNGAKIPTAPKYMKYPAARRNELEFTRVRE